MRALRLANDVRSARARLKREIAVGEISAADVLLDPPAEACTWPLGELLVSQRGWGRARCKRLLARHAISEMLPVGRLTERQRSLLVAHLPATQQDPAIGRSGT